MRHVRLNLNITMAVTHTRMRMAAQGWDHVSWQSDFYPQDLPMDWRLPYYSNEFSAVTVPAATWVAADASEIQSWVEETTEDFLFYPEVMVMQTDGLQFARKSQQLGEKLGGILLHPGAGQGGIQEMIASFEQASEIAPSCMLLSGDRSFTAAEEILLAEQGVELAWRIENSANDEIQAERADPPRHSKRGLAVIQVAGNTPCSSRKLREIIEASLRRDISLDSNLGNTVNSCAARDRIILLMFEGNAADIGTMRAAGIIGDLLEMPVAE